jgi:hypothetical protein
MVLTCKTNQRRKKMATRERITRWAAELTRREELGHKKAAELLAQEATMTPAYPLTILIPGWIEWGAADSDVEAMRLYREAIGEFGRWHVRIIDSEGRDVTNVVKKRYYTEVHERAYGPEPGRPQ